MHGSEGPQIAATLVMLVKGIKAGGAAVKPTTRAALRAEECALGSRAHVHMPASPYHVRTLIDKADDVLDDLHHGEFLAHDESGTHQGGDRARQEG